MRGLRDISTRLAQHVLNMPGGVPEDLRELAEAVIAAAGEDVHAYLYVCDGVRKTAVFRSIHAFQIAAFLNKGEKIKAVFIIRREYSLTLLQAKALVEQCGDSIVDDLLTEQANQTARREMGMPLVHEDQDAGQEEVVIMRSQERPTRI
jgi:ribosomal protein L7/L12